MELGTGWIGYVVIACLLAVCGSLLNNLVTKLEDGNKALAQLQTEVAKLNVTIQNYQEKFNEMREWQVSQDKEIKTMRERIHALSDIFHTKGFKNEH